MDYIVVLAEMCMQHNFHLDLLRGKATGTEGMFLVDELDGDDGFRCVLGDGFANTAAVTMLANVCVRERETLDAQW